MTTDNGGPAFPVAERGEMGVDNISGGMTLRDWFAGMALQGILASQAPGAPWLLGMAEDRALRHADEMIARRLAARKESGDAK